jgi:hypothetical protein
MRDSLRKKVSDKGKKSPLAESWVKKAQPSHQTRDSLEGPAEKRSRNDVFLTNPSANQNQNPRSASLEPTGDFAHPAHQRQRPSSVSSSHASLVEPPAKAVSVTHVHHHHHHRNHPNMANSTEYIEADRHSTKTTPVPQTNGKSSLDPKEHALLCNVIFSQNSLIKHMARKGDYNQDKIEEIASQQQFINEKLSMNRNRSNSPPIQTHPATAAEIVQEQVANIESKGSYYIYDNAALQNGQVQSKGSSSVVGKHSHADWDQKYWDRDGSAEPQVRDISVPGPTVEINVKNSTHHSEKPRQETAQFGFSRVKGEDDLRKSSKPLDNLFQLHTNEDSRRGDRVERSRDSRHKESKDTGRLPQRESRDAVMCRADRDTFGMLTDRDRETTSDALRNTGHDRPNHRQTGSAQIMYSARPSSGRMTRERLESEVVPVPEEYPEDPEDSLTMREIKGKLRKLENSAKEVAPKVMASQPSLTRALYWENKDKERIKSEIRELKEERDRLKHAWSQEKLEKERSSERQKIKEEIARQDKEQNRIALERRRSRKTDNSVQVSISRREVDEEVHSRRGSSRLSRDGSILQPSHLGRRLNNHGASTDDLDRQLAMPESARSQGDPLPSRHSNSRQVMIDQKSINSGAHSSRRVFPERSSVGGPSSSSRLLNRTQEPEAAKNKQERAETEGAEAKKSRVNSSIRMSNDDQSASVVIDRSHQFSKRMPSASLMQPLGTSIGLNSSRFKNLNLKDKDISMNDTERYRKDTKNASILDSRPNKPRVLTSTSNINHAAASSRSKDLNIDSKETLAYSRTRLATDENDDIREIKKRAFGENTFSAREAYKRMTARTFEDSMSKNQILRPSSSQNQHFLTTASRSQEKLDPTHRSSAARLEVNQHICACKATGAHCPPDLSCRGRIHASKCCVPYYNMRCTPGAPALKPVTKPPRQSEAKLFVKVPTKLVMEEMKAKGTREVDGAVMSVLAKIISKKMKEEKLLEGK